MTAHISRRALLIAAALLAVVRAEPAHAVEVGDVAALNGLLTTEHAVIYDLAAAGATVPVAVRAAVLRHYDEHRQRRDELTERIRTLGGAPVAALPAYADPAVSAAGSADFVLVEQAAVRAYHGAISLVSDRAARVLCVEGFVAESRHLALARAAAGLVGAPVPFVTGA